MPKFTFSPLLQKVSECSLATTKRTIQESKNAYTRNITLISLHEDNFTNSILQICKKKYTCTLKRQYQEDNSIKILFISNPIDQYLNDIKQFNKSGLGYKL